MSKVEDGNQILNSVEQLERELGTAANTLLPLMNSYLKDVRSVRMAFATEVQHITSHIVQLRKITELTGPLGELTAHVAKLSQLLTPEMVNMLKKITKDDVETGEK